MGMSSSQARLLNLTARMHQIEYKAAKLEAQKLQMANDSKRVYNDYLNALEASKIQYKSLNTDGSITYNDATLKSLENGIVDSYNGKTAANTLFLQNIKTGKLMFTQEVIDKFNLNTEAISLSMDEYVEKTTGLQKTLVASFDKVSNQVIDPIDIDLHTFNPIKNEEGVVDPAKLVGFANFDDSHRTVSGTALNSVSSISAGGNYTISSAAELQKLLQLGNATNTKNTTFTLTNDIDMSSISNWTGIQNFCGNFDGNGYKISNLTGSQGLFATATDANIENVKLENVTINSSNNYVGALVGKFSTSDGEYQNEYNFAKDYTATISNCTVVSTIDYNNSIKNNNTVSLLEDDNNPYRPKTGTGGLIGYVYVGRNTDLTITNVSADVDIKGTDGIGGLIGTYASNYSSTNFVMDGVYATGDVEGVNCVGGLVGHMYNDQDDYIYDIDEAVYTGMRNTFAGGTVKSTGAKSGGLIGSYSYYGDNGDYCELVNCNSIGTVYGNTETSSFVGAITMVNYNEVTSAQQSYQQALQRYNSNPTAQNQVNLENTERHYEDVKTHYLVNFVNCGFIKDSDDASAFGVVIDNDTNEAITGEDLQRFKNACTGESGFANLELVNTVNPNAVVENILAAMSNSKVALYDHCKNSQAETNATRAQIKSWLNTNFAGNANNENLYFLNDAICKYLLGNISDDLGLALQNDILNNNTENTSAYFQGRSLEGIGIGRDNSATANVDDIITYNLHEHYDGKVTLPSKDSIKNQVFCALNMAGKDIDEETVNNWVDLYDENINTDLLSLANINNIIQNDNQEGLEKIYTAILNDNSANHTTFSGDYNIKVYGFNFAESSSTHREMAWDTSIPEIANAIAMWTLAQRGVELVDDDCAENMTWLNNIVNDGFAVLTTFDIDKLSELGQMSSNEVLNMTDDEYYSFIGIDNTSIAINTSIQEVADKTLIKKAEAKYEADMKRIDMKDRKYDIDLAALEAERNAIKQEMETLKTVAKENVDRTFKLFS